MKRPVPDQLELLVGSEESRRPAKPDFGAGVRGAGDGGPELGCESFSKTVGVEPRSSAAPHSGQNRLELGISRAHAGHRIAPVVYHPRADIIVRTIPAPPPQLCRKPALR